MDDSTALTLIGYMMMAAGLWVIWAAFMKYFSLKIKKGRGPY